MNKLKNNKVSSAYQENLFMELFNKYLPYWPLFILIILIFICGATLLIKIMIPKYESTATLIIKDEKKGAEDSKTMEALNMMNAKKIIENEMEVLQSRTIMENVAKNLHLYAPIFKEGRLRNSSAYYLSPVSVIAFNPDSIKEIEKVNVDYKFPRGEIFLNNKFAGMLNQWILTPYGKLKFIPNKNYIPSAEKENIYFSLIKPKDVSKNISKNLTVLSINKLSSIITLNYKDEIPQQSEDILNEIILMYDKVSIDEKNSLAKSTLQFVNDRLNAVSKDLDVIEKTVQQYKAGSGTSDISMQGQMYLQNVSYNDQELGKLNMELAILNQADKSIDNTNSASSDLIPSIIGISDPHIAQLITELNNKELEYERLKKTVAENNPLLLSIKDQINKIKPGIAENIRSKKKNLEASKGNLLSTNSRYASMLSSIPQKEKELLEISRDQNVKNSIYSFLLQKKEESELSYASNLSDSRVINSAQSSKYPVSPNKLLIYLGALIAAFVSVLLFITVKEGLNKKVLYRKEIESMTAIPVIGELALHKPNLSLLIEPNKKSLFAEEFRKIRISLHFLGLDKNHKKILITSSIPGEGKSFFAANIAISIALSGKNVVLVDLDLHNPGLGKIFEKKNRYTWY